MILKKIIFAHLVWHSLGNIFRNNKYAWVIWLDNELRSMVLGDFFIINHHHHHPSKQPLISLPNLMLLSTKWIWLLTWSMGFLKIIINITRIICHKDRPPLFLQVKPCCYSKNNVNILLVGCFYNEYNCLSRSLMSVFIVNILFILSINVWINIKTIVKKILMDVKTVTVREEIRQIGMKMKTKVSWHPR